MKVSGISAAFSARCHARRCDQIQQRHAFIHSREQDPVDLRIARHCPENRGRRLQYGGRLLCQHVRGARNIGQSGDFAEKVAGVVEVENAVGGAVSRAVATAPRSRKYAILVCSPCRTIAVPGSASKPDDSVPPV